MDPVVQVAIVVSIGLVISALLFGLFLMKRFKANLAEIQVLVDSQLGKMNERLAQSLKEIVLLRERALPALEEIAMLRRHLASLLPEDKVAEADAVSAQTRSDDAQKKAVTTKQDVDIQLAAIPGAAAVLPGVPNLAGAPATGAPATGAPATGAPAIAVPVPASAVPGVSSVAVSASIVDPTIVVTSVPAP